MILEKIAKRSKKEKLGKIGPLRRSKALRHGEGLPHSGEAQGPEKAPSGLPRRSPTTLRRSALARRRHSSQRQKILDFVPKASYSYTDCLGTLIND